MAIDLGTVRWLRTGRNMGYVEQAKATATALENEGFNARLNEQPFDANPYGRRSKEWEMWRLGWSRGDYTIWYGILMEKRRSQADE